MTIDNGTAIVLAYVLASIGLIIAFLLAAFVIGWFVGRLRERRRGQRGDALASTLRRGIQLVHET
jgi:biotin transporter BioY